MKLIVVGAGAAGYFAAIRHKDCYPDHEVVLLEKAGAGLAKVKVSGGGRCNVTHGCFDARELVDRYPRGAKALIGPFRQFQPRDTMTWFEARGVALKIEKDGRVFPTSDSSQSIIDVLVGEADCLGVNRVMHRSVTQVMKSESGRFVVVTDLAILDADAVILATGSSRDGYQLAEGLGHTIQSPVPSLFTFKIEDSALWAISGVAVPSAVVTLGGRTQRRETGPVLVTHWGFSGPSIIKLSAWGARDLAVAEYCLPLTIRWLSTATEEQANRVILDLQGQSKKQVGSRSIFDEIPTRLWQYLVHKSVGKLDTPWNETGKRIRHSLVEALLRDRYEIVGKGVFKDEFVTCGGVTLDEVNFKTMESRICPGLYFAGEVLDIDGITGGFNFQNAWTTGWIAGSCSGLTHA